ncbi:pyridoxal-phosphate dependent enzyme [Shewanella sp. SP2S2-6]|uniref:pyridoxal-phosphate dependent enzyme n=1 Tax=Shewanella sp. SP2S2-6 TaxID=3063540 RepID=UPI0028914056|nr:pyridoxal-phosphate dependent enzyme [Shewanella sp. SP2S2-6]MDT3297529.1 pyridoxal-phosphate dependent enzyme [Shewanella sp. SP2S2-6]
MTLSIVTPLIESLPLSDSKKTKIWLKMEASQPSGSFKIRGIGYACEWHAKNGAQRFISSSGGNAGLAVAYAGRKLNIPVIVIVPQTTSDRAKFLLELEGAEVVTKGNTWVEANQYAISLCTKDDAFIHPFDDPLLWHGHASMIDEVVSHGVIPDAVVLSVGGGGLLAGVDEGLRRNNLANTPIFVAETEGMASYKASLDAGKHIELEEVSGIATSLGAKKVCSRALDIAQERKVTAVTVTDTEAVEACLKFLDDHRVLVEPACGAALALLYGNKLPTSLYKNVLVIVCGGSTTTINTLQDFNG